jgi:hypothetical protein
MLSKIQYCTDTDGNPTAVIIPIEDWEKLQAQNKKMKTKLRLLTDIRDAVGEVKKARKDGKNLTTLDDFINECRS